MDKKWLFTYLIIALFAFSAVYDFNRGHKISAVIDFLIIIVLVISIALKFFKKSK